MKNITANFSNFYLPVKSLVVYQSKGSDHEVYVEAFDINQYGKMYNAHPLSDEEAFALSESLRTRSDHSNTFLQAGGLLPDNLLYLRSGDNGCAIWYTPPQKVRLLFKEALAIPSGETWIPALIWYAGMGTLYLYAVATTKKPNAKTQLYHAPFFNVHEDGKVCMGTVDVDIAEDCSLEEFITTWQDYFFQSYFSHAIAGGARVKGSMVHLWREQMERQQPFPNAVLVKNDQTLNDLIAQR